MRRAAAPDESHQRAVVADEGEQQRRVGGIAETGTMIGGGWGRLAARGEDSRGGDGMVTLI
jgi:hypothetical protein